MPAHKRTLAHADSLHPAQPPAARPSPSKRRKPSPSSAPPDASSADFERTSRWVGPWGFFNQGIEAVRRYINAHDEPALPSPAPARALTSNGVSSSSSKKRPRPAALTPAEQDEYISLLSDYKFKVMDLRARGGTDETVRTIAKPQRLLDLEARMKALQLRTKSGGSAGAKRGGKGMFGAFGTPSKGENEVNETNDAGAVASPATGSTSGPSGYQRRRPMGGDKNAASAPLSPPPPSAIPITSPATPVPPLPRPAAPKRVLRPPWAVHFDPDARPPSPVDASTLRVHDTPFSFLDLQPTSSPLAEHDSSTSHPTFSTRPSSSSYPRDPARPSSTQHKRTLQQRDASTLAQLREQGQSQGALAGESASPVARFLAEHGQGLDGALDDEEVPDADAMVELSLYRQRLNASLDQEERKAGFTSSRPLHHGRSSSSIVNPSALDRPSHFPSATRQLVDRYSSARPALSARKSSASGIDHALQMARKSFAEPRATGGLQAFEHFEKMEEALRLDEKEALALETVKVKKRQFPTKLSKEHRARVKAVLADPRYESTIPGASASARDMRRLKGQDWLNDELINYIGVLINNRSDAADKDEKLRGEGEKRLRKAFVFNTNFFTMFGEQGFAKVKRWTRKFDTFEKDIIIIPVNHNNNHWCCAAINLAQKRFEYYDSLGRPRPFVYDRLRNWLAAEHKNRKKSEIDLSDWEDYWLDDVPQQNNANDCGMFTCMFMESLSREVDFFDFKQENMPYLREKMALQIDKRELLDLEPWA
ncbi:uncharacterized protein JCM10292_006084 [Rhodotorula paludigena]|uniref:uncharacterized protein n=1 Tax=Rhodotorula paludigena TaxID=86838 RepID=UPI00317DFEED